jgi:Flp pilus assembly protein TadB
MSGIRGALILGAIPVIVGIIYLLAQELLGSDAVVDPAGYVLLIALGISMGFGMFVILRGARDL